MYFRRIPVAVFLQFAFLGGTACADDFGSKAQALLEEAAKAKRAVGMTASIWKDGKIAWEGAAGFADIENKVPATPEMVHRIASISKPISATAAMQLVEQGKINLDAPIQTYVPEFPKKELGDILVWHLLSHTSGIRHHKGSVESNSVEHFDTTIAAIARFKNDPLLFAPGTRFHYSTYGYTLLAAAIESASGEELKDYMQKHVWGPAGMTSTRFEERGEIVPHRSRGYQLDPHMELKNALYTDDSVSYAGGGMLSTAGDLVRFAAAVQNGTLIKRDTFERMLTPPTLADGNKAKYGLGWFVEDWKVVGRIATHSGGQSGTATDLLVCLDQGVAVAVISNTRGYTGVNEVASLLANLALGVPPPEFLKIQPEKSMAERVKEGNEKQAQPAG